MTSTTLPTRRKALKLFAGVPLLPLGASGAAAFLAGCGGGSDDEQAQFAAATFTSMAAPTLANPGAMASTSVGSALKVTMSDQSVRSFDLAYQPFFITGDAVPDGKGGMSRTYAMLSRMVRPSSWVVHPKPANTVAQAWYSKLGFEFVPGKWSHLYPHSVSYTHLTLPTHYPV